MSVFKNFRNVLGFALVLMLPALWALQGLGILAMPEAILGAMVMGWTIVIQFYFRKSGPSG